jgi:hypothetical protein
MFEFKLPAANTISIPAGQPQNFATFVILGRASVLSYEEDNDFEDETRGSHPRREDGWSCEEPMLPLHRGAVE